MQMFATPEIGGSVADEIASSSRMRVYNRPRLPALAIYIVWWRLKRKYILPRVSALTQNGQENLQHTGVLLQALLLKLFRVWLRK